MATRQIRIGSMKNIHQYDDGVHSEAADFDGQPIKIGGALAADEAVRQDQLPSLGNMVSASANMANHALIRGDGGIKGLQDTGITVDDSDNMDMNGGDLSNVDKVTVSSEFIAPSGNTANRPGTPSVGMHYFDTTIGKPIWYDSTNWIDATGAVV